jgi:hypothetical protein
MVNSEAILKTIEVADITIKAFHGFKYVFDYRREYRINSFLRDCYKHYLNGGKDSEKARLKFIHIVDNDPEILTGRLADFVNQVIFCSSDLCSICYSFLYNKHRFEDKDIFGIKGQTFENLATTTIQGMSDRDIQFYISLFDFVSNHDELIMEHSKLKLYGFSDKDIEEFLSSNSQLKMTYEGFVVLCDNLIRRRILVPDFCARLGSPLGFGIGKYSKDFYDLFNEADDFKKSKKDICRL